MCNLYANTLAPTLMRQLFKVRAENDQLGNAEPLTAIFPKGTAPIVALDDDCNRDKLDQPALGRRLRRLRNLPSRRR